MNNINGKEPEIMSGEVNKAKEITYHQNEVKVKNNGEKVEKEYQNTIFTLKDEDGVIQKEDLQMSVNRDGLSEKSAKLLDKIDAFFTKHANQKWNVFLRNYIVMLADRFNHKSSYKSKDVTYDKYGDVQSSYTASRSNNGQLEVTETSEQRLFGGTKSEIVTVDKEANTKNIKQEKTDSHGTVRRTVEENIDKENGTATKEIKKFRRDGSLKKTVTYQKNKKDGTMEVVVNRYDKKGNVTKTQTYTAKDYKPELDKDFDE